MNTLELLNKSFKNKICSLDEVSKFINIISSYGIIVHYNLKNGKFQFVKIGRAHV